MGPAGFVYIPPQYSWVCLHFSPVYSTQFAFLYIVPVYSSLPQSKSRFPRLRLWHLCDIICMTFDLVALLGFILHKSMRSANLFGFIKEIHKKNILNTYEELWLKTKTKNISILHPLLLDISEGNRIFIKWISSSAAELLDLLDGYLTLDIKLCC